MYQFKKELKKSLLEGRTIKYIAEITEFSEVHLSNILSGKKTCKKSTAYFITKMCNEHNEVEDYFIKIR